MTNPKRIGLLAMVGGKSSVRLPINDTIDEIKLIKTRKTSSELRREAAIARRVDDQYNFAAKAIHRYRFTVN